MLTASQFPLLSEAYEWGTDEDRKSAEVDKHLSPASPSQIGLY